MNGPDTAPDAAQRDTMRDQKARLIDHLKRFGRKRCPDLASACDVPSVTKRICELIAGGWPIGRTRGRIKRKRGGTRRATFYELTGPHPQADLFGHDTTA